MNKQMPMVLVINNLRERDLIKLIKCKPPPTMDKYHQCGSQFIKFVPTAAVEKPLVKAKTEATIKTIAVNAAYNTPNKAGSLIKDSFMSTHPFHINSFSIRMRRANLKFFAKA